MSDLERRITENQGDVLLSKTRSIQTSSSARRNCSIKVARTYMLDVLVDEQSDDSCIDKS
jgi:hypothetical protein